MTRKELDRRPCRCQHPAFAHDPGHVHACLHPGCPCLGWIPEPDPRGPGRGRRR